MEINPFLFLFNFFGLRLIFVFLLGSLFYIYFSRALQLISLKLGYKKDWIAWVPVAQLFLLPILAKKKWYFGFVLFLPTIYFFIKYVYTFFFDYLLFFLDLIYLFFIIFWLWIIFERLNFPGYFSLILMISVIPVIGMFSTIIFYLLIGIAAVFDMPSE